ncbi:DUF4082 domain-containing protein [Solwaraspora sp. WMMD791]|uniref:DUF4082 domain-containing protein n=1 Tax=Solwaraspora sp. WMMD791 TaxID=3016086 RepID=UPI00249CF2F2|nr:DUF4082 domain-containing protein [Solwaraspora sp. WMMD791]WFE30200.1 DUF4082 domain-containing protein [Solwaraspora sp. WMMD791]
MLRRPTGRRGRLALIGAVVLSFFATATVVTASVAGEQVNGYTFFADSDVSKVAVDPDSKPVELGLRFTSSADGTITSVRFLKAKGDRSAHRVSVWNARGKRLASAIPTRESRSGWQQVTLPKPVDVVAGEMYVVSYHTSRYRASQQYFAQPISAGPLTTVGAAGVYAYGSGGFPEQTWEASNYWVDLTFQKARGPGRPEPGPSASASPIPTPSASPTVAPTVAPTIAPTVAPQPTATAPTLDLPRVGWEGGPSYYAAFPHATASGWTNPSFFPIGVWYEGVYTQSEIDKDREVGLNTYVMLTDQSDLGLIRRNGMTAMTMGSRSGQGDESIGWILQDEVDMWGGAGDGTWTGKYPGQGHPCVTPNKHDCGFDVMDTLTERLPDRTRMRYTNYGKGVMFWQSDGDAARFVNNYTDIISNDIYWYTDPNVCYSSSEGPSMGVTAATCRRAANYGLTMDRMRELDAMDGKRQPIYAFVEVGHPFTENDAPTINGDQIAGAVMNSLIHEARGILYFNHNFGGSCISQHVLRDTCGRAVRPAVTELNKRVTALAPVLNTQSYEWEFNPRLDTMLKAYDGSYYVFAMLGRDGTTGPQQLKLPPGLSASKAEVLFENRTVAIADGVIQDGFSQEFTYHIYKITP